MGVNERKEREKESRRESIVDAAEKMIQVKGFEGMTIDDVAVIAELGKGTIYLYFKNKTDLYHAVICRGLKILKSSFEKEIKNKKTGMEKLVAIGRSYFQFCFDYPIYFNAMSHRDVMDVDWDKTSEFEGVQCCEILGDQIFGLMTEVIKKGIEDKTIQAGFDPMKLSMLLWAQVSGILKMLTAKGEMLEKYWNTPIEELIELQFQLMKRAISPLPEPGAPS